MLISTNTIFAIIILIFVVAGLSKTLSTVARERKSDMLIEYD